jgi:hypothetical protein
MGTSSNTSAGTQITQKGPVQGTALVDPIDGLPVDVHIDTEGTHRLCVDADLTLDDVTVNTRDLAPNTDTVSIGNKDNNGNTLNINNDGSIDVNTIISATGGDSIAIEDPSTGYALKVNSDGSINVDANTAATPTIYNVLVSTANTEVSQVLPSNSKQFIIQVRNSGSRLQLAFISGASNTDYVTIPRGCSFQQSNIDTPSLTLYFQTNQSNQTVEILAWN